MKIQATLWLIIVGLGNLCSCNAFQSDFRFRGRLSHARKRCMIGIESPNNRDVISGGDKNETLRLEALREQLNRQFSVTSEEPERGEGVVGVPGGDETRVESARERLTRQFSATSEESELEPWAVPVKPADVSSGTLLLGNPKVFCSPNCPKELLEAVGLAQPLPVDDLGGMRVADLLPVVLVLGDEGGDASGASEGGGKEQSGGVLVGSGGGIGANIFTDGGLEAGGMKGLLMNRRTGYLLGDLPEEEDVEGFMIQPLNLGGREDAGKGMTMLHPYPQISGSVALTPEEASGPLCFGGAFQDAQQLVKQGTGSQWEFKFFVQAYRWKKGELDQQLADGVWLPAKCAKEVVLKIREREGTQRPKPLWTDALELCGGDYAQVTERLFGTAGPTNWDSAM